MTYSIATHHTPDLLDKVLTLKQVDTVTAALNTLSDLSTARQAASEFLDLFYDYLVELLSADSPSYSDVLYDTQTDTFIVFDDTTTPLPNDATTSDVVLAFDHYFSDYDVASQYLFVLRNRRTLHEISGVFGATLVNSYDHGDGQVYRTADIADSEYFAPDLGIGFDLRPIPKAVHKRCLKNYRDLRDRAFDCALDILVTDTIPSLNREHTASPIETQVNAPRQTHVTFTASLPNTPEVAELIASLTELQRRYGA
jgi:hypothetical protein